MYLKTNLEFVNIFFRRIIRKFSVEIAPKISTIKYIEEAKKVRKLCNAFIE